MRSIGVFGALAFCLALAQPAVGQNEYRQSYTAEKEHGTFIAYLKTRPQTSGQSKSNGFITDVELGLKWTGLLGQPVESYTLKWHAGDRYRFFHEGRNEYVYVRRDDLRAHPDLLAEYDAIKPSDIALEFWLEADAPDGSEPPRPNEFSNYGAFNKGALGRREVRRTPHLVIDRAGCRSSDIAPSSPRSYTEFVRWKRNQTSGTNIEIASKNTLNAADTIRFKDLTIKSVELPNYKFKNIYDELQRRNTVPDDPVSAARKAEADAFWGTERPDASGNRVVSVAKSSPCIEPPAFAHQPEYKFVQNGGYDYFRVEDSNGNPQTAFNEFPILSYDPLTKTVTHKSVENINHGSGGCSYTSLEGERIYRKSVTYNLLKYKGLDREPFEKLYRIELRFENVPQSQFPEIKACFKNWARDRQDSSEQRHGFRNPHWYKLNLNGVEYDY